MLPILNFRYANVSHLSRCRKHSFYFRRGKCTAEKNSQNLLPLIPPLLPFGTHTYAHTYTHSHSHLHSRKWDKNNPSALSHSRLYPPVAVASAKAPAQRSLCLIQHQLRHRIHPVAKSLTREGSTITCTGPLTFCRGTTWK